MTVTPLTYILTFLILLYTLIFFKNREKYVYYMLGIFILFETFINRGYFIDFGFGRPLYYNEFLLIALSLLLFVLQLKNKYSYKIIIAVTGFVLSIIIGFVLLLISKPDYPVIPLGINIDYLYYSQDAGISALKYIDFSHNHYLRLAKILLYTPIVLYIGSKDINYINIYKILIIIAKFICFILVIEMIFKLVGFGYIYDNVLQYLYNEEASILYDRVGLITLSGLSQEPSHLGYGFFIILFVLATKKINNFNLFILIIILLFFSMSFGNFMIALICTFVYIYHSKQGLFAKSYSTLASYTIGMLFVMIILFIFSEMISYNTARVISMFTGEFVGSEGIRLWSIGQNMQYFVDRPLFGLGLGSTISNGFIPSMLANIGLVGLCLWFVMHSYALKTKIDFIPAICMFIVLFFTGDIGWLYSIKSTLVFLVLATGYTEKNPLNPLRWQVVLSSEK